MNIKALGLAAKARGISRSELARRAGVSRQAVSAWFHSGRDDVAVRDRHLLALSRGLDLPPETLTSPLFDSGEEEERIQADLLWDRLYPDVGSFALALAREEPQALARLVSRVGLFEGAAVAGTVVWRRFHDYARFLAPARRKELEPVWQLQSDLGLI